MVFSLFGWKGKPAPPKAGTGSPARAPNRPPDARMALEAQREAARVTSRKIDEIESEMMSLGGATDRVAPGTTQSAAVSPTTMAPALSAAAVAPAPGFIADAPPENNKVVRLPPRNRGGGHGTTALIGHTVDANAIDIFGSTLPPLLEEAAILYANGQSQQAEAVLRQSLEDPSTESARPLVWMMLLDLYQTTGDKLSFEEAALAYASKFEASAPGWEEEQASAPAGPSAPGSSPSAALPAHLNERVAGLCDRVARSTNRKGDAVIDCAAVRTVEASGAAPLVALVESFAAAGRGLVVVQPAVLFKAARDAVETGRRDASPACWMLALLALRLLGERQQFEDLAIEYCVTYEVSPPSWEPLPNWIRIDARTRGGAPAPLAHDPRSAAFSFTGDVLGRMEAELSALRAYANARGDVVIDCRRLRRIDFVAAGELLNVIVALGGAGKQVLFVEPNHLVLALLMLMGIVDLVEVRSRRV